MLPTLRTANAYCGENNILYGRGKNPPEILPILQMGKNGYGESADFTDWEKTHRRFCQLCGREAKNTEKNGGAKRLTEKIVK